MIDFFKNNKEFFNGMALGWSFGIILWMIYVYLGGR